MVGGWGHSGSPGSEVRVGEGHPEIWGLGSRTLCGSPPGSPQTLQAGLGGLLSPPSYPVPICWAHLESQDLGCTGPHGLYTLVGGQVRSADTRTGVRWAKEARAPGGHSRLTAQPAGGVAPVGAHAPGAAERRVGLQALAERFRAVRAAGPAAVADTGAEERAGRDEAVAPSEHPVGRAGQRPRRCPGGGCPRPPAHAEDSRAQHQLAEGFRGTRSGGGCAGCRQGGAGGRGQPSRCPAALPAAVGDQPGPGHVLAGGGHGAVGPATVIPAAVGAGAWGGRGRRITLGGHWTILFSPSITQLPWQPVSYETLLPAGAGGRESRWEPVAGAGGQEPGPPGGACPQRWCPAPRSPSRRPAGPCSPHWPSVLWPKRL